MAITNIVWSETSWGPNITEDIDFRQDGGSLLGPGLLSAEKDIYIRHSGVFTISGGGIYVSKYSETYDGDTSANADLVEVLKWGNEIVLTVGANEAANYVVGASITGVTSGATGIISNIQVSKDGIEDDYVAVGDVTGTFQIENITDSTYIATVSNVGENGLYISLNSVDLFADYVSVEVASTLGFQEGVAVEDSTTGATGTIVKISGTTITLNDTVGTFTSGNTLTDNEFISTTITQSGATVSSWYKVQNGAGHSMSSAVALTVDSIEGGAESGQLNGELFPGQTAHIRLRLQVPNIWLSAGVRQFDTILNYTI